MIPWIDPSGQAIGRIVYTTAAIPVGFNIIVLPSGAHDGSAKQLSGLLRLDWGCQCAGNQKSTNYIDHCSLVCHWGFLRNFVITQHLKSMIKPYRN
jgi:hypothetical protein